MKLLKFLERRAPNIIIDPKYNYAIHYIRHNVEELLVVSADYNDRYYFIFGA